MAHLNNLGKCDMLKKTDLALQASEAGKDG